MKSKYYFPHTATVFFLLTVAVALFSWIGSIYGLGKVQSLLSPEGIRWELRHAMGNFVQTPALGIVMMLFLIKFSLLDLKSHIQEFIDVLNVSVKSLSMIMIKIINSLHTIRIQSLTVLVLNGSHM